MLAACIALLIYALQVAYAQVLKRRERRELGLALGALLIEAGGAINGLEGWLKAEPVWKSMKTLGFASYRIDHVQEALGRFPVERIAIVGLYDHVIAVRKWLASAGRTINNSTRLDHFAETENTRQHIIEDANRLHIDLYAALALLTAELGLRFDDRGRAIQSVRLLRRLRRLPAALRRALELAWQSTSAS